MIALLMTTPAIVGLITCVWAMHKLEQKKLHDEQHAGGRVMYFDKHGKYVGQEKL